MNYLMFFTDAFVAYIQLQRPSDVILMAIGKLDDTEPQ